MGCDIHYIVQAKRDGAWIEVDPPDESDAIWTDNDRRWFARCRETGRPAGTSWPRHRNYDAFAILADVRNGTGFAGCLTGEPMIPVVPERRGLPDGMASDEANGWCFGDHSFHWLTLAELVEYPHWEKRRAVFGVVGSKVFAAEMADATVRKAPSEWCGARFGGGSKTISEVEWYSLGRPVDDLTSVQASWGETYAESAGSYHSRLIPCLIRWAERNGVAPCDVRIVMGFDS